MHLHENVDAIQTVLEFLFYSSSSSCFFFCQCIVFLKSVMFAIFLQQIIRSKLLLVLIWIHNLNLLFYPPIIICHLGYFVKELWNYYRHSIFLFLLFYFIYSMYLCSLHLVLFLFLTKKPRMGRNLIRGGIWEFTVSVCILVRDILTVLIWT